MSKSITDEGNETSASPVYHACRDHAAHDRSTQEHRDALIVGLGATMFALVLYAAHSNFGIVAGPWQGVLAESDTFYSRPLLWTWAGHAVTFLAPSQGPALLCLMTVVLAASCCGLVAMVSASAVAGVVSRVESIVCGCAAGILFALTHLWIRASMECSPAPLTLLLALGAFWLMMRAGGMGRFLCGGVLIGLATANHPSFAVLALLLAILVVANTRDETKVYRAVLLFGLGFAAVACVPVVAALVRGEGLAGFLSHALQTPYPTVGDAAPEMNYGYNLAREMSTLVLLAALPGLVLLTRENMRRPALVGAFIFLSMGPFLPALTNHRSGPSVVTDTSATMAMVLAAVCLYVAWGVMWLTTVIVRGDKRYWFRAVAVAVAACILAVSQWKYLPSRPGNKPLRLAEAVLADCPENAILVTGDAGLHSMLLTVHAIHGYRVDVTLIPADALTTVPLRARAASLGLENVQLDPLFPPVDAVERWGKERPLEVKAIAKAKKVAPDSEVDLQDLALWDFVRDNFARRPIAFVGVAAPWLTARAQRNGVVLVYPRQEAERTSSFSLLGSYGPKAEGEPKATALSETMLALLLPLSDTARRQSDVEQAAVAAALARQFAGGDARPWLSSARAAARSGDRDQALAFIEQYLRRRPAKAEAEDLTQTIQEDLLRSAISDEYAALVHAEAVGSGNREAKKDLADQLWALDELTVLAAGYADTNKRDLGPRDVDDLCDLAAVLTQLGHLQQARRELSKAISFDIVNVRNRLLRDPRFILLLVETAKTRATSI